MAVEAEETLEENEKLVVAAEAKEARRQGNGMNGMEWKVGRIVESEK